MKGLELVRIDTDPCTEWPLKELRVRCRDADPSKRVKVGAEAPT